MWMSSAWLRLGLRPLLAGMHCAAFVLTTDVAMQQLGLLGGPDVANLQRKTQAGFFCCFCLFFP